jgi:nucleoside-diphosphate-sugar epimerase
MDLVTNKPILVTGANGFLGAHVVSQLLARGYPVRGTVRPKKGNEEAQMSKTEFVASSAAPGSSKTIDISALYSPYARMSGVNDKLEFVEADVTTADNWDAAFKDVEYVIHTAAPYILGTENPQLELMQPIVEGTRRILELCQKSTSVKKLIYISCMSALGDDFDSIKNYDEDDWNTKASLTRNPHAHSKTMAEKLVLSFAGQVGCRFSVVTLVPGMLWGPPVFGKRLSFSHKFLTLWLNGEAKAILNLNYNLTDVRDLAHAIIIATEQSRVQGRYCIANEPMSQSEILQIVHENFVDLNVPSRKVNPLFCSLTFFHYLILFF